MSLSALPAPGDVEDIEHQQEIHESGSKHEGTAVLVARRYDITLIAQQIPQSEVWNPRPHRSQSAQNRQGLIRKDAMQITLEQATDRNRGHDDEKKDRSSDLPSEDEVSTSGNQPSGNQRNMAATGELDFGRIG